MEEIGFYSPAYKLPSVRRHLAVNGIDTRETYRTARSECVEIESWAFDG